MSHEDTMNDTLAVDAPSALRYARTIADLPSPKGHPFVGNALQLAGRQMHQKFTGWVREYGPMFRLDVLGHPVVIVSDAATVHALLRDRPEGFRRAGGLKQVMSELNIGGVFIAEGEAWRKQRKLVMSGLNVEVIRHFFPTMAAMTQGLHDRWTTRLAQGQPIDLKRDLKAMALDIIVGLAMGHRIDAVNHDGDPLQKDIDRLFDRLGQRTTAAFPYWRHVKLPADRAAERASAEIETKVVAFIRDTRERMDRERKPSTMLEAMIVAAEDPDSGFTDEELVSNAILSVVGGEDTTANSIGWMVYLLARHPEAAAALRAEVDAVLGDATLPREWEQLKLFTYLDAAHSETQRLRTVAPYIGLTSNADCVVADTFIPKNTAVIVATAGEGFDDTLFPEPAAFRPERWIAEHRPKREEDPARRVFPFGGGSRLCPGRFLALTEIKMVVAMIVRNFDLTLEPGAPEPTELLNFFMAPSAVPVRLAPRALNREASR